MTKRKTILFSGRFCRPHVGHIITIGQLAKQYENVIIAILDYPEQYYPIWQRLETLANALLLLDGNYQLKVSPHHFGKITKEQLEEFPKFNIYGTGNVEVLEHMRVISSQTNSFVVEYVPRYPGYAASDDVKMSKIREVMGE